MFQRQVTTRRLGDVAQHSRRVVEEAERAAETRLKDAAIEAKEVVYQARTELEQEVRERQKEIQALERRLSQKEEQVSRRLDQFDRRDRDYHAREEGLRTREQGLKEIEAKQQALVDEQRRHLERIAGLTAEEAKQRLLAQMEAEARREAILIAMRLEEEAREGAERKAREVLATTIQRLAADYTVETTVSVVHLPTDDMKGRIIGREGRNIRAFEMATGVDVIIDDTPEAVILSGFDPVRREIAQARAPAAGRRRPHPSGAHRGGRREGPEGDRAAPQGAGRAGVLEVGVHGLHPEMVQLLGRLQYRTSYGQNILQHSKEVAWLAGMMAAELGVDVKLAKRGGLLHDIGKAMTHEQEGSHAELSMELRQVRRAAGGAATRSCRGHDDGRAGDGRGGAGRGGRRRLGGAAGRPPRELENYIKRLEALEKIAAVPGGGEVLRDPGRARGADHGRAEERRTSTPTSSPRTSPSGSRRDAVPRQIKVIVIRETRAMEYANEPAAGIGYTKGMPVKT